MKPWLIGFLCGVLIVGGVNYQGCRKAGTYRFKEGEEQKLHDRQHTDLEKFSENPNWGAALTA